MSKDEAARATSIWNRACLTEQFVPQAGDRALVGMIVFHSVAMNGGVLHAIECSGRVGLAAAIDGYRFFELNDAADLIGLGRDALETGADPEALEAMLDESYGNIVPDDAFLFERFRAVLLSNPTGFAST
jgi:hypothetical protein